MLSIGIVGLPNVGKSTLFNALTKKSVPTENFPFCTIDPSVGVVAVPDPRLAQLSRLSKSDKAIPAAVQFIDIAGLVQGASTGEGLGNQFLAHIREVDVIAHVVRVFDDPDIAHVHGEVDPAQDIEVVNLELMMADLQTVSKRLSNIDKDIRGGDKGAQLEKEMLQKVSQQLEKGKLIHDMSVIEQKNDVLRRLHLLTAKPMFYVLNKKSGGHNLDEMNDGRFEKCKEYFEENNFSWIAIDAGIEQELNDVSSEEKQSLRQDLGAMDAGVDDLIRKGYDTLGLITFFTIGEKEIRGWTVKKDSTVREAGSAVHSDFRDKFIRAEVIHCDKLLEVGSYAKAREQGLVRTEGKNYIVQDGDVIKFKI